MLHPGSTFHCLLAWKGVHLKSFVSPSNLVTFFSSSNSHTQKMTLAKLLFLNENYYLVILPKIVVMVTKKSKGDKNDCNFNTYGCILYWNEARLSVSQIFITVIVIFLREFQHRGPRLVVQSWRRISELPAGFQRSARKVRAGSFLDWRCQNFS